MRARPDAVRPRSRARALGEQLIKNVEALALPHEASTVAGTVTISVGGASVTPRSGDSSTDLIAAADAALYEAKRSGKNRIVVSDWDPARSS